MDSKALFIIRNNYSSESDNLKDELMEMCVRKRVKFFYWVIMVNNYNLTFKSNTFSEIFRNNVIMRLTGN